MGEDGRDRRGWKRMEEDGRGWCSRDLSSSSRLIVYYHSFLFLEFGCSVRFFREWNWESAWSRKRIAHMSCP